MILRFDRRTDPMVQVEDLFNTKDAGRPGDIVTSRIGPLSIRGETVTILTRLFWFYRKTLVFPYNDWLVVWNMTLIFPYLGNDDPIWRSYFWNGMKPTRWTSINCLVFFFPMHVDASTPGFPIRGLSGWLVEHVLHSLIGHRKKQFGDRDVMDIMYPVENVQIANWKINMLFMGKLTTFQLGHFQ